MSRRIASLAARLVVALGVAALGCASAKVSEMPIPEQDWQRAGAGTLAMMRDLTECTDYATIPSELHQNEDGTLRVERRGVDDDKYIACMTSKGWKRGG